MLNLRIVVVGASLALFGCGPAISHPMNLSPLSDYKVNEAVKTTLQKLQNMQQPVQPAPVTAHQKNASGDIILTQNIENALLGFGLCTFPLIKQGHYPDAIDASGKHIAGGEISSSDYKPPKVGKSIFILWANCAPQLVALRDACIAGGKSSIECSRIIAEITNKQIKKLGR
jgi:hypothetical protein